MSIRKEKAALEKRFRMKSLGIYRTRKGANVSRRDSAAFMGLPKSRFQVSKVPFSGFSSGTGFMIFYKGDK